MYRALVVGGTRFVGRHTVETLLESDRTGRENGPDREAERRVLSAMDEADHAPE